MKIQSNNIITLILFLLISFACYAQDMPQPQPPGPPPPPGFPIDGGLIAGLILGLFYGVFRLVKSK